MKNANGNTAKLVNLIKDAARMMIVEEELVGVGIGSIDGGLGDIEEEEEEEEELTLTPPSSPSILSVTDADGLSLEDLMLEESYHQLG